MPKKIKKIIFPKDEQAHDNIIEWWYFNGHLSDKNGNKYTFMDCFFKADPKKINIPFLPKLPFKSIYFAHCVLSNIGTKKSERKIQYIAIPSKDSFTRPLLFINYSNKFIEKGFVNYVIEELKPFKYRIKTETFDLVLTSTKPPMLEGGKGFIKVCSHESYYYSLTNLKIKGLVKVKNKYIEITGKAWMDHQWADVSYNQNYWNWFSIQLTNNTEIMCCEYSDRKTTSHLVDIFYKNSKHAILKKLKLTPAKKVWKSPITKAQYPLGWKIEIPEKKITLTATPLLNDQEMVFGKINYWEGPLKISGKMGNKKVKGIGFMELLGYKSDYSNTRLLVNEIKNIFNKGYKNLKRKIL